jgi:hypothetical protein
VDASRRTHGQQQRVVHCAPSQARQHLEDPFAALLEHLQRLQQLGRLLRVCLQQPLEEPGQPREFRAARFVAIHRWELPFVVWAEQNGYPLEFAANDDLEFRPEMLASYKLVLSVGHDEYWSTPMRDNLEAWIAKGGNVAFFSGNTCCWQVRSEAEGRAFTCFKQNYHLDPVFQTRQFKTLSTAWSHHLLGRSENSLTGVGFLWGGYMRSHGQFMDGDASYIVHRPDHWIYEGTGLKRGDRFGAKDTIVGYECDGCELEWRDGLPFATHKDGTPKTFEVLGTCPVRWHPDDVEWYEKWEIGRTGAACLGLYTNTGTVFTAATTDWAHGLQGNDCACRAHHEECAGAAGEVRQETQSHGQ